MLVGCLEIKKHMNVSWVSGVKVSFSILLIFIMILLREKYISINKYEKESKGKVGKTH